MRENNNCGPQAKRQSVKCELPHLQFFAYRIKFIIKNCNVFEIRKISSTQMWEKKFEHFNHNFET